MNLFRERFLRVFFSFLFFWRMWFNLLKLRFFGLVCYFYLGWFIDFGIMFKKNYYFISMLYNDKNLLIIIMWRILLRLMYSIKMFILKIVFLWVNRGEVIKLGFKKCFNWKSKGKCDSVDRKNKIWVFI